MRCVLWYEVHVEKQAGLAKMSTGQEREYERARSALHGRCEERLQALKLQMGAKVTAEGETSASVEVAHEKLVTAGKLLAQAGRVFYFLLQSSPSGEDIQGGERDLEKAIVVYDSWARTLMSVVLPVARKEIGNACCLVLKSVMVLTARTSKPSTVQSSDCGPLEEAVESLASLEVSGVGCCKKVLKQNAALIDDALRELRDSIAEANQSSERNPAIVDDDPDEDDEDDADGNALLEDASVAAPLESLVCAALDSFELARRVSAEANAEIALTMLITCAQAASSEVDNLVCAADEEDGDGVRQHARSLARLLLKLHQVLSMHCGVGEDAQRVKLEAAVRRASDALQTSEGSAANDSIDDGR